MLSHKRYSSLFLILCVLAVNSKSQVPPGQIKPSILNEWKDFENLISKTTIDEIAAKHLITDSEFRHALKFLKSSQMPLLIQRLQQIPEVIDIFEFLHIWENKSEAITRYSRDAQNTNDQYFIDFVLIDANDESEAASHPVTEATQKIFSLQNVRAFVLEVLGHLNRNDFANLIKEKCITNADFNTMYKGLRSAEFRPKVEAALKTTNVMGIVELLKQHGIDVNVLEPIGFEVLSWGPPAVNVRRNSISWFMK